MLEGSRHPTPPWWLLLFMGVSNLRFSKDRTCDFCLMNRTQQRWLCNCCDCIVWLICCNRFSPMVILEKWAAMLEIPFGVSHRQGLWAASGSQGWLPTKTLYTVVPPSKCRPKPSEWRSKFFPLAHTQLLTWRRPISAAVRLLSTEAVS